MTLILNVTPQKQLYMCVKTNVQCLMMCIRICVVGMRVHCIQSICDRSDESVSKKVFLSHWGPYEIQADIYK